MGSSILKILGKSVLVFLACASVCLALFSACAAGQVLGTYIVKELAGIAVIINIVLVVSLVVAFAWAWIQIEDLVISSNRNRGLLGGRARDRGATCADRNQQTRHG